MTEEIAPVPVRVELEGQALARFLTEVVELDIAKPGYIHTLRIFTQDGIAKWKINEGTWTPPYPNDTLSPDQGQRSRNKAMRAGLRRS